jgi:hypothetical protein
MQSITRFYFGHHKCASQYIKTILRQSAQLMGWSVKVDGIASQLPMDYHRREPFAGRILTKQALLANGAYDLICLENADNAALATIEAHRRYRGVHVIRDPRDIVVSGYFSHRYSHPVSADESPWLWDYRRHLATLPDLESGLLAEIEFCATYFARLAEWNYANPHILEVRYETLIAEPLATFTRIYQFLGIQVPMLDPLATVELAQGYLQQKWRKQAVRKCTVLPQLALWLLLRRHAFARKSGGRARGAEDVKHHYRKGIAGDWRNYFTPRVTAAFKRSYPNLLRHLGYEAGDQW